MTRRHERGFTLIELAVSLGVFAIAVLTLSLLFDRALESTAQVRFDETAKTVAQDKLEEVRSLPVYVPQSEETGNVDVLDLYFPNTTGATVLPPPATGAYDATANVWTFTTTIDPLTVDGRDFRLQVGAQFVTPTDGGALVPRQPTATYNSDVADVDDPPSNSVKVTVTVSRLVGGQTRQVSLDTIMVRREETEPSVEASAQVHAADVSGVAFQDGDAGGGIAAEILATVAQTNLAFREVTGSTSQASADPLEVVEREPIGNVEIARRPTAGSTAASVPNSTTGDVQVPANGLLAADSMSSVNGVGAIAAWGSADPSGTAAARVSKLHSLQPEGRAAAASNAFELNARDAGESVPLRMIELGRATSVVEQGSTTTGVTVVADVNLETIAGVRPGVAVFASRDFGSNPNYRGVVTIGSVSVDADIAAASTSSTADVSWRVNGLRVWDPNLPNLSDPANPLGDYGPPFTFGFIAGCGGWIATPPVTCPTGLGTPNPVVIPAAYAGAGGQTSLAIVSGLTAPEVTSDPAVGFSTASLSQKNVLSIVTRDDIAGAAPLEPMSVVLGSVNVSASFLSHEH